MKKWILGALAVAALTLYPTQVAGIPVESIPHISEPMFSEPVEEPHISEPVEEQPITRPSDDDDDARSASVPVYNPALSQHPDTASDAPTTRDEDNAVDETSDDDNAVENVVDTMPANDAGSEQRGYGNTAQFGVELALGLLCILVLTLALTRKTRS